MAGRGRRKEAAPVKRRKRKKKFSLRRAASCSEPPEPQEAAADGAINDQARKTPAPKVLAARQEHLTFLMRPPVGTNDTGRHYSLSRYDAEWHSTRARYNCTSYTEQCTEGSLVAGFQFIAQPARSRLNEPRPAPQCAVSHRPSPRGLAADRLKMSPTMFL